MSQQMIALAPDAHPSAASVAAGDPRLMELSTLSRHARIESRHFYQREAYDQRFAYELFRRALVERDEAAWSQIFEQYTPLVEYWVRRTGAFPLSGESSDAFVGEAFTRFWRAIPPDRFGRFPSLASLLHYLRRCATCVVIDMARAHAYAELLPEECVNWNDQRLGYADEEATEQVSREEFWRLIDELLTSEAERVVVRGSYLLGMKPGAIYARWPALFSSIEEVYTLKRSILSRLRRNPELQQLY